MSSTHVMGAEYALPFLVKEQAAPEIVYPDSDGAPMGETGYHVIAIMHLYSALCRVLKNTPDIYVAADMFLYYQQGNPRANKAPDVMVIKGVPKHLRRSFKTWEEGAVPCVIFEVTSKSTQVEDTIRKSHLYARLGVREYFVFDPLRDYVEEGLIGLRLEAESDEYTEIRQEGPGVLFSEELGVFLMIDENLLRVIDPQTHKPVPDFDEALVKAEQEAQRAEQEAQRAEQEAQRAEQEAQRAKQEAQRAEQETQRAEQERQRANQAEAELARLRALLEQQGQKP